MRHAKALFPGREATLGADQASRAIVVLVAASLGLFILWGAAFAQPNLLHDAAHDSRHGFAFPCH